MSISIKQYGKDLILKTAIVSGVNAIFGYLNKTIVILRYHGVCEDDFTLLRDYDERHVPVSIFERQILYLKSAGYKFLNMTEVFNALNNGKRISDKLVCLTFDDGFENVVKNAYPLMVRYGARGCFYVVPGLIGAKDLLWTDLIDVVLWKNNKTHFTFEFDEDINYKTESRTEIITAIKDIKRRLRSVSNERRLELLKQFQRVRLEGVPRDFSISSWDQVRILDPRVLEIGSHTLTHPNLDTLNSENEFQREISHSKDMIEQELQRKINHFCYPAGIFNDNIKSVVKKAGYATGVSTIPGSNSDRTDPFELRRIEATSDMTSFKTAITGFGVALDKL